LGVLCRNVVYLDKVTLSSRTQHNLSRYIVCNISLDITPTYLVMAVAQDTVDQGLCSTTFDISGP